MAARVAYWPLIRSSCSGRQPAHMSRAAVSWLPASGFQLPCADSGEPMHAAPLGIGQAPIRIHSDSFGTGQPFFGIGHVTALKIRT